MTTNSRAYGRAWYRKRHPQASRIANDMQPALLSLPTSTIVADACHRYGCHHETARAAVSMAREQARNPTPRR